MPNELNDFLTAVTLNGSTSASTNADSNYGAGDGGRAAGDNRGVHLPGAIRAAFYPVPSAATDASPVNAAQSAQSTFSSRNAQVAAATAAAAAARSPFDSKRPFFDSDDEEDGPLFAAALARSPLPLRQAVHSGNRAAAAAIDVAWLTVTANEAKRRQRVAAASTGGAPTAGAGGAAGAASAEGGWDGDDSDSDAFNSNNAADTNNSDGDDENGNDSDNEYDDVNDYGDIDGDGADAGISRRSGGARSSNSKSSVRRGAARARPTAAAAAASAVPGVRSAALRGAALFNLYRGATESVSIDIRRVNWDFIAQHYLRGSKTALQCRIHWAAHADVRLRTGEWSTHETQQLRAIADKHGARDWARIAAELGTGRAPHACLRQYQRRCNPALVNTGGFSAAEDQELAHLVAAHGDAQWALVAAESSGRRGVSQLQNRWRKAVDPTLRHGRWTVEEDIRLLLAVKAYARPNPADPRGPPAVPWAEVQMHVPGRTDGKCRERYLMLSRDVR